MLDCAQADLCHDALPDMVTVAKANGTRCDVNVQSTRFLHVTRQAPPPPFDSTGLKIEADIIGLDLKLVDRKALWIAARKD